LTVKKRIMQTELRKIGVSAKLADCAFPPNQRTPCPEMMSCRGQLSMLSYCWQENFTDPHDVVTQKLTYSVLGSGHVASLGYPASEGHLFLAQDMFVNWKGDVFNDQYFFFHGGCKGHSIFTVDEGQVVRKFKEAVNLNHLWGHNFYHLMGEMLPRTFQVRDFIIANPHIPIMVKVNTAISKLAQLLRLPHVPEVIFVDEKEAVFVERVHFPLKVVCGKSSRAVWEQFRAFFFKESVPAIVSAPRSPHVTELKIVVARRLQSRRIIGFDELVKSLSDAFPDKVVVFYGNEGLAGSVNIFSNAAIYVASHGAGLTNMAFMPYNGIVLELLPDQYHNHCFGHMASALQLEYHMIMGSGKKRTGLTVDLIKVVDKVVELSTRFN
jgi:hypothetical protein